MNNYIISLIDEHGNVHAENHWVGYGPSHAIDDAIMSGAIYIPPGFMGYAHAVNPMGIAYKLEIGFAS